MTLKDEPLLVGLFCDVQSLDEAVNALQTAGIDRSQLSMLSHQSLAHGTLPADASSEENAARSSVWDEQSVHSETDIRQLRTMLSGMAGTAGGAVGVGVAMVSGAAVLPALAVAAGAGLGSAAVAHAVGRRAGKEEFQALRTQIEHGGIVLWVTPQSDEERDKAGAILRKYAAKAAHPDDLKAS